MSASINKVILLGNLGADPEIRTFQNGGRVANLRLATSKTWKDRTTGEKRESVQWHSVVIFNDALVGIAEKYLRKGSKVCVQGALETRKWTDQSGQDRYSTEVALRPFDGELTLLGGGGSGGSSGSEYGSQPRRGDLDDEIPF